MARGAADRGKKIAFGENGKILWNNNSEMIFQNNPNIAQPGQENLKNLEWIRYFKGGEGSRIYNRQAGRRWIWNYDFRPIPGEIYFNIPEKLFGQRVGSDFIVVEPHVPEWKTVAANKRWPLKRYQQVVDHLVGLGHDVRQFSYGQPLLDKVKPIKTPAFRYALAALKHAKLYIGPEGGLHHGAAAVGVQAVVIFGGFIPPQVTGYDFHTNIAAGGEACGNFMPCDHCTAAMHSIDTETVIEAALARLSVAA